MRSLLSRILSQGWAERSLRLDEGRKAPEILLSKLRNEKREQVPAVHGATLRVPFRDFPDIGFVRSRKNSSLLNLSGIGRDGCSPPVVFNLHEFPNPLALDR